MDIKNFKKCKNATGVDTSYLAAKRDFIALKTEVDILGINRLVNVSCGLNNLKIKVGELDRNKLKTIPVDLKKSSDAMSKIAKKKQVQQTRLKSK